MQDNTEVAVRVLGFKYDEGAVFREVVAKARHPVIEIAVGAPEVELASAVSEVNLRQEEQLQGVEHGGLAQIVFAEKRGVLVDADLGIRKSRAVDEDQLLEAEGIKGIKAQIHRVASVVGMGRR